MSITSLLMAVSMLAGTEPMQATPITPTATEATQFANDAEAKLAAIGKTWSLAASGGWYDFSGTVVELPGFVRRFAGRAETGRDSVSDPAMGF